MAWCPKCKYEYVEGVKVCADCGSELVDSLEEVESEQPQEISMEMTAAMMRAMQEVQAEQLPEEADGSEEKRPVIKRYVPYMNNEEKAEENKAAAYTLLLVGSIGLICIILLFFDMLPVHMSVSGKYMTCGVMGVTFILFIVMGAVSMRNSRILKKKAKKENNLTVQIKKWCLESFHKDEVDKRLELEELMEELKYFPRFAYMKTAIKNQYMNLDESYLDRLIEEIYPEIFEKEEA